MLVVLSCWPLPARDKRVCTSEHRPAVVQATFWASACVSFESCRVSTHFLDRLVHETLRPAAETLAATFDLPAHANR